jgi:hypothetical protein
MRRIVELRDLLHPIFLKDDAEPVKEVFVMRLLKDKQIGLTIKQAFTGLPRLVDPNALLFELFDDLLWMLIHRGAIPVRIRKAFRKPL